MRTARLFISAAVIGLSAVTAGISLRVAVAWTNVPGQGPRYGVGGPDQMADTNSTPLRFYRPKVALPE